MIEEQLLSLPHSNLSVTVNGHILEDEVLGFRVESVTGRFDDDVEINETELDTTDEAYFNRKKYKPRDITVFFNLVNSNTINRKTSVNTLKSIINENNSKIIFNDEPDLYYIGNISKLELTKLDATGSGYIVEHGRFEIHCGNRFKYSTKEKIVEMDPDGTFSFNYEGTYPSRPNFLVRMHTDNGFIGFVNDSKSVLAFGSPEEVDGYNTKRDETLTSITKFLTLSDESGSASYLSDKMNMGGTMTHNHIGEYDCLMLASKPSNSSSSKWNGAKRTLTIPADSNGSHSAKNFYCYFNSRFETGLMGQTGRQTITFLTSDDKVICGYSIHKVDTIGNTAYCDYILNGKVVKTIEFIPSMYEYDNPFNQPRGHSDIRKEGSKVTFYWWGTYPSFTDPAITNMECSKIQITLSQFGDRGLSDKEYITCNHIRSIRYMKLHVNKWIDSPNKFSKGSVANINTTKGEITLDGLPKNDLGRLGNDWENFKIKPGVNQIKVLKSSWAQLPDVQLRYREVYI